MKRSFFQRRPFFQKAAVALLLAGAATAFVPQEADARPGGGNTFRSPSRSSGGSSSRSGGSGFSFGSGSSSGGGGIGFGGPTGLLVAIVVAVFIIAVVVSAANKRRNSGEGWSTGGYDDGPEIEPPRAAPRANLASLRAADPDFSRAVFEDFAYSLYSAAHLARAEPAPVQQGVAKQQPAPLDRLAPYLSDSTRRALTLMGRLPVQAVVIGAMRIVRVERSQTGFALVVEFESNISEKTTNGEIAWWAREEWTFARKFGVKSRPPERSRTLDCPNCGAALDKNFGPKCRYCSQVVDTGAFDWVVERIRSLEREQRAPMLTGDTAEVGTDRLPVVDPGLRDDLASLSQRDPAFQVSQFKARVGVIYTEMLDAWSSLDWHRARPYLSDNLHEQQSYWIEAYRRQGLRNKMKDPKLIGVDLVKIDRDKHFDSITVRLEATGCDYTTDVQDKRVVSGSKTKPRRYAEYWTLIRSAKKRGPALDSPNCPNCGAPLADVNMAGNCGSCKVKVNSGEFDWVLARIEQDEVYAG